MVTTRWIRSAIANALQLIDPYVNAATTSTPVNLSSAINVRWNAHSGPAESGWNADAYAVHSTATRFRPALIRPGWRTD